MSLFCCPYFENLNCITSCDTIILNIDNLPIGQYTIEYWYNYSNFIHKIDVITTVIGQLILPQRFNYNYVNFKIKDNTDNYYCISRVILTIPTDVCCFTFNNIPFIKHNNSPKENCLIDKNKILFTYEISEFYNYSLQYIQISNLIINLEDYCGTINQSNGIDLLNELFNNISTCTSLNNFLTNHNIIFTRTGMLEFQILIDKDNYCCQDTVELRSKFNYKLFGSNTKTDCCNDTFSSRCLDGGIYNTGTQFVQIPLTSASKYVFATSCIDPNPIFILENYSFLNYQQLQDYLNLNTILAEFEAYDDGIIIYFKNLSCADNYVLCQDDVVINNYIVNCC